MSFTSMHNDHLDPDRAGLNDENWSVEYGAIEKLLKEWSSNRWHWSRITYCLTGKDADLESHGQQGVELVSVNEDGVEFIVHGGKTVVGDEVCLNLTREQEADDTEFYKCRDAYLKQMYEFVSGSASMGEWDGDSWYMTLREDASVPWSYLNDEVTPDYEATCNAIIAKLEEVAAPWEAEMASLDHWGEVMAGWKNEAGERIKEGDPTPEAAWGVHDEEEGT